MYRFAIIAFALFSSAAEAAPVYLTCHLNLTNPVPGDHGGEPMNVTLNESEGTVTYEFPGIGRTFTGPAAFTAEKVKFGAFTIDRRDLSFARSDALSEGAPPDRGTCAIVQVKRAF